MQQVQSQNEKMVPIDTSGEPVEVELKDENQKENETPVVETQEETPVVEVEQPEQPTSFPSIAC